MRWKLFLLLVPLTLSAGLLQLFFSTRGWKILVEEMEQQIHWGLATEFVEQIQPLTSSNIDRQGLERLLLTLSLSNPKVEFVVLDERGEVMASIPTRYELQRHHIDLAPLKRALEPKTPRLPLYGDDPFSKDTSKIFSVAPLQVGGRDGFLYVPLMSATYDFLIRNTGQFYLARTLIQGILISTGFALGAGLFLSLFLTRRFERLSHAIGEFQSGNESVRAPVESADELAQISLAFNTMADRIAENIRQLREKDALRRELVANISHDLRGPVSSMLGYLEKFLENPSLDQSRLKQLKAVQESAQSQQRLVEDLFELSSLEANEKKAQKDYSSLGRIAESVISSLNPQFESKGVALSLISFPDLPLVFVDAHMIQRVLINLLTNALRFTPASGRVDLRLLAGEGGVECSVSDTGAGIAESELPKIFDSFYTAVRKGSDTSVGTGLGLAIVKKLLELHHTLPRVESRLDEGTTVSFILFSHTKD